MIVKGFAICTNPALSAVKRVGQDCPKGNNICKFQPFLDVAWPVSKNRWFEPKTDFTPLTTTLYQVSLLFHNRKRSSVLVGLRLQVLSYTHYTLLMLQQESPKPVKVMNNHSTVLQGTNSACFWKVWMES